MGRSKSATKMPQYGLRCVGCRRIFADWYAFNRHGDNGRCATQEEMNRAMEELKGVWSLRY